MGVAALRVWVADLGFVACVSFNSLRVSVCLSRDKRRIFRKDGKARRSVSR
jgi:hypothetical protein